MSADAVAIIEAAYQRADSEQAWLQGLAAAALTVLDRGLGLNAYTYDAQSVASFRVTACASAGGSPVDGAAIEAIVRQGPSWTMQAAYEPGPPTFASDLFVRVGSRSQWLRKMLLERGLSDVLAVRGCDWSYQGVVLAAPWARKGRLPPAQLRMLQSIGAHLGAGYRLRRARATTENADAVLDPQARLLHLAGKHVEAHSRRLRRSAGERALARGRLRRHDPDAAIALWRAMVQGEWTLVDHLDSDGKRLILAKRNQPDVGALGALGLRERQVAAYAAAGFSLKHIAYELGLSSATVSEHLKLALRKLRLRDRSELVAILGRKLAPGGGCDDT